MKKLISIILLISFSTLNFAQKKNIFEVARSGTVEEIKIILKEDPKQIDAVNSMSFSPLILACYRGNTKVAEYLIDNSKNLDYASSEGTALAALSINYNKELVQKILEKGANPNIKDPHGNTPLLWAVKRENVDLVSILLEHGALKSIRDNQGLTAFEHALQNKNPKIIELLKD